jgi:hypothetical protein
MNNKEKLLHYLKSQFSPMDNHFTYDMVENLIDYGMRYHNVSQHQLAYFLSDIIPETEFDELDKIIK